MLMRIGVMLAVTGFAMIVMSWVVPLGGVLIIFGALASAVAVDDALGITVSDAHPIEARDEPVMAPVPVGRVTR